MTERWVGNWGKKKKLLRLSGEKKKLPEIVPPSINKFIQKCYAMIKFGKTLKEHPNGLLIA